MIKHAISAQKIIRQFIYLEKNDIFYIFIKLEFSIDYPNYNLMLIYNGRLRVFLEFITTAYFSIIWGLSSH